MLRSSHRVVCAITGVVDSDYAGSIDTRKSQTCYVFTMYQTSISWKANLQYVFSLSTTDAEYKVPIGAVKRQYGLKVLLQSLGMKSKERFFVAVKGHFICQNIVSHERSKHIDVCRLFVRDVIIND